MHAGSTVSAQFMDFAPQHEFRRLVARHRAGYRLRQFSCWDQFLCMAFAQLTCRESRRDFEACLRAELVSLGHPLALDRPLDAGRRQ